MPLKYWHTADWILKIAWLAGVRRSIQRWSSRVSAATVGAYDARKRNRAARIMRASREDKPGNLLYSLTVTISTKIQSVLVLYYDNKHPPRYGCIGAGHWVLAASTT